MPLNLVPQIFFDLIARIIPGSIFLTGIVVTIFGLSDTIIRLHNIPKDSGLLSFWTVTALLALSYVVGFTLTEFWKITLGELDDRAKKKKKDALLAHKQEIIDEHSKMRRLFKKDELKLEARMLPRSYVMHDHLRQDAGEEAYRLLKLRAEERLCNVIVIVLGILFLLNLLMVALNPARLLVERIVIGVVFVGCAILLKRRGATLGTYYKDGLLRSWLIHFFPLKERKAHSNP